MKTVIVLKPSDHKTFLNLHWNIFLTVCEETAEKNTSCWETPTPSQLHSCPSLLFILKRDELYTHLSFISSEGRSNSLDIPSLVRAENTCPLSIQASSSDLSIPFHIIHSRMSVSNCTSSLSLPCKRSEILKVLLEQKTFKTFLIHHSLYAFTFQHLKLFFFKHQSYPNWTIKKEDTLQKGVPLFTMKEPYCFAFLLDDGRDKKSNNHSLGRLKEQKGISTTVGETSHIVTYSLVFK